MGTFLTSQSYSGVNSAISASWDMLYNKFII